MTKRQTILIVDDRPENLVALEQTLADLEATVIKATSGNEALTAILNHDFALAILDVQMPNMDGYELAEFIRSDTRAARMPIIFLTAAYGEDRHVFRGYDAGAVDYIIKPFNPRVLLGKINIFLELDRQHKELTRHRKHLEELVAERTAELKRSNKDLEQFAYVASHDLQEPLRMVASYTQLLAERYESRLDERADKYIQYAVEGARRMQYLINDLLAYSRLGTRGRPLKPVSCSDLVTEVLHSLQRVVEENSAEVIVGDLPEVVADRTQLGQVFQNLISNAIKFRRKQPPRVEISAKRDAGMWEFCVKDNGIGIKPQFFDRIFVIFQRLHERGAYSGSGIGLAIVKKIVERHGGSIRVESGSGSGSCFFFTIPGEHLSAEESEDA